MDRHDTDAALRQLLFPIAILILAVLPTVIPTCLPEKPAWTAAGRAGDKPTQSQAAPSPRRSLAADRRASSLASAQTGR